MTASTAPPVINLAADPVSSSEVDLSWVNNDPNTTAFEIDRSTDATTWQTVATTPDASTLNYHDIGLPVDTPYYYRVRPVLPPGPGKPSFPVVASTPIVNPSSPPPPTTYWVAPNGSGTQYTQSSPGLLPALVNYLDTAPAGGTSIVYLETGRGNYVLSQTLQIDGNASNVTFEPVPGSDPSNPPVITSGIPITNWSANPAYTVPASGGNPAFDVYSAPLNSAQFPIQTQMHFRDFYLNGERALLARTPAAGQNYDYIDSIKTGIDSSGNPTLTIDIPQADAPNDGSTSFADFVTQQYMSDPDNAVAIAFICGYNESQLRIKSATPIGADYALAIAPIDAREFDASATSGLEIYGRQQPFFLENAPQFLHPGEFYENTATQTVYYAARNSNDVAMLHANDVTVPAAISDGSAPTYPISGLPVMSSPLVEIGSDAMSQQVQNVTITGGIAFEYSSWVDPSYYGYMADQTGFFTLDSSSGPASNPGPGRDSVTMQVAAVRIEHATGVSIQGDLFEHLGGAGVEIYDQSSGDRIARNTFADISGNGINVNGDPADLGNPIAVSAFDSISDNTVSTIGAAFPDSCAIFAVYTDDLAVSFNDIHDIPEMGISLGGQFATPGPNTYTLADVEWNNIYQFGEKLQDGGGIYLAGLNWKGNGSGGLAGTRVANNYIHDNPFSQQDGSPSSIVRPNGRLDPLSSYAIYLESTSSGVTAVPNDTFDIRSGTGKASQENHFTKLSATLQAGPNTNILEPPEDSSVIIDTAGPDVTNEFNQTLSSSSTQVAHDVNVPYTGTYRIAVRVQDVRGPASAFSLTTSLSSSKFIERLVPSVNAANILLPWVFSSNNAQLADLQFAFAGGRTSSLILEAAWLVPVFEDPFAT